MSRHRKKTATFAPTRHVELVRRGERDSRLLTWQSSKRSYGATKDLMPWDSAATEPQLVFYLVKFVTFTVDF